MSYLSKYTGKQIEDALRQGMGAYNQVNELENKMEFQPWIMHLPLPLDLEHFFTIATRTNAFSPEDVAAMTQTCSEIFAPKDLQQEIDQDWLIALVKADTIIIPHKCGFLGKVPARLACVREHAKTSNVRNYYFVSPPFVDNGDHSNYFAVWMFQVGQPNAGDLELLSVSVNYYPDDPKALAEFHEWAQLNWDEFYWKRALPGIIPE